MKILKVSIAFVLAVLLTAMVPAVSAEDTDSSEPTAASQPADESGLATESEPTEESNPTEPSEETVPEPTQAPTEPAPTAPIIRTNYSNLTLQIALANGLNQGDYTAESWALMEEALEEANSALKSSRQYVVDCAAETLQEAMDGLVEMDYTALQEALEELETFRGNYPEIYDLWFDAAELIPSAETLFGSGDQAGVDAAAAKLRGLLSQLEEKLSSLSHPVTVVQEVEVEVLPETDYCNIRFHETLPVLLIASLVVNLGLVVTIVILVRKKKNRIDDTPLIDYDIDDDEMDGAD